ncbi:hypothetical protein D5018_01685 [Parashewanella curva]|uniref:Uncharacterized protein n=1 Tax=Parashewanella curva TaxID=2338552 RepID=A0A3L8Q2Y5_9GAMM|nr:hypothetical protein [Parashewanella curva]RLV61428.1 hypothetical protein D5018_01685 [Parashewanella curva]
MASSTQSALVSDLNLFITLLETNTHKAISDESVTRELNAMLSASLGGNDFEVRFTFESMEFKGHTKLEKTTRKNTSSRQKHRVNSVNGFKEVAAHFTGFLCVDEQIKHEQLVAGVEKNGYVTLKDLRDLHSIIKTFHKPKTV